MKYLAVLGRLAGLSAAELTAQFGDSVRRLGKNLALFESIETPNINRFGGVLKFGHLLEGDVISYLKNLPEGKITLGISDYSKNASARSAQREAMKLKKILAKAGRSVRVLSNITPDLSTATSHHNQLGEKPCHVEIMILGREWYISLGTQNITAYKNRDQVRPARDAKVGMLPPKLAQILINLTGKHEAGETILDPFCGTGVVLQEAMLMGYRPYGTDLEPRMIEYSEKNLNWLRDGGARLSQEFTSEMYDGEFLVEVGDATEHRWQQPINAVACEGYLGQPMSQPPAEIKLKQEKEHCKEIILGFLKNIHGRIEKGTPLALAVPAWLRPNGEYERLNILDEIERMGYNHEKYLSYKDSLYYRDGQVVAREIIVLRKK